MRADTSDLQELTKVLEKQYLPGEHLGNIYAILDAKVPQWGLKGAASFIFNYGRIVGIQEQREKKGSGS